MKTDLSIIELIQRVRILSQQKRDYLLPANQLGFKADCTSTVLSIAGTDYPILPRAAAQLASIAKIPYAYYQRLYSYPELLQQNMNTLLADISKNKLVRILGNNVRAVLSDHYKKIEHEELLGTVMPLLDNIEELEIVSSSLTEDRLYLKAICPIASAEVKVGDAVNFGFIITNSEVGCSSVVVQPYAEVLKCTNGMILPHYYESTRKIHLGKKIQDIDTYDQLYENNKDNLAEIIRFHMKQMLDSQFYNSAVAKMREATEINVPDANATIEKIAKAFSLSENEKQLILFHFIADKDTSLWGLVNAITETSKQSLTYERATQLETIGSQVLYSCLSDFHRHKNSNDYHLIA